MGGWFKREINTPADLQGLAIRTAGLVGEVYARRAPTCSRSRAARSSRPSSAARSTRPTGWVRTTTRSSASTARRRTTTRRAGRSRARCSASTSTSSCGTRSTRACRASSTTRRARRTRSCSPSTTARTAWRSSAWSRAAPRCKHFPDRGARQLQAQHGRGQRREVGGRPVLRARAGVVQGVQASTCVGWHDTSEARLAPVRVRRLIRPTLADRPAAARCARTGPPSRGRARAAAARRHRDVSATGSAARSRSPGTAPGSDHQQLDQPRTGRCRGRCGRS